MKIVLCAVPERVAALATVEGREPVAVFTAADASEALGQLARDEPAVVLVGGRSAADVADACRRIRRSASGRDAVIVAIGSDAGADAAALLEAGADDFIVGGPAALEAGALQSRLRVAERAAGIEASRRAAEREHEQFFRLSLQLFCVAGFDGYFKILNPAWTEALGWSADELLASPWLEFVHPDDVQATLDAGDRLARGAKVINFTNRYRCRDGTYRWLDWQSAPAVERGAIYGVARDITEARADKDTLQELSQNLATTLDSIADGVIATTLEGIITRINPAAEQLTGWTAAAAKGRPVTEVSPLIDEDTRERVEHPVLCALRGAAASVPAGPTLLVQRSGGELPIANSCGPIRRGDGTVSGAVLVLRSLTAQRSAALVEAKFRQQLVFSDRMASVGTLAAGVAHEINNPLSYVAANVEIALEEVRAISGGSPSGRMKELEDTLREAREGVTRVTKIVRGLKTFSRIEEERVALVEVVAVIEISINMAFNEIRHRARLVKDYGPIPPVTGDDARLGQVFINLLVNAAHAFTDGDTGRNQIRVVTSTGALGHAVVEVQDNGPGIPPATLGRIFDPFFTTKPVGVGTGLGLAISHNIVTGMGGEITVQSEVGRGTTFRVTLPPAVGVHSSSGSRTARANVVPARRATVLVVDDEPAIGLAIRRVLRHHHDVTVVTGAKEALDLLAGGSNFDVVLSDLMMPGVSGMEMYRQIALAHPRTAPRVVFLTGGAFTPEANAFLDRVGNERMEKPFEPGELRDMIQKFVK